MFDDYEDYDPEFEEISLDSFGGVDASNDDFDLYLHCVHIRASLIS